MTRTAAAAALIVLLFAAICHAQTLRGVVTDVKGMVQMRAADDQPWQFAKPGMNLTEGAEFRTGPRSAVRFRIEPDQEITLDRLGVMKVARAVREADGAIKTDLGMQYGRSRYQIHKAGIQHESTVRMPSAVLGIRGTIIDVWEEFDSGARSHEHFATFTPFNRHPIRFGEGTHVDRRHPDPGSSAEDEQLVDTDYTESTAAERDFLANRPDLPPPHRPHGPLSLHQLRRIHDMSNTGSDYHVDFTMTWTSNQQPDDINLFTYDDESMQYISGPGTDLTFLPTGYPTGGGPVQSTNTGGQLIQTANGINGTTEIIRYTNHPQTNGTFGAQIVNINGGGNNTVTIQPQEFVNGQPFQTPNPINPVIFNLTGTRDTGPAVPPNHPFNVHDGQQ